MGASAETGRRMNAITKTIRRSRPVARSTASLLLAFALASPAWAQFGTVYPGFYTLPKNDFTWLWGDPEERDFSRSPDFTVHGNESGFECALDGRLRPGSHLERLDIREMERNLSNSLFFIQDTVQTLNVLDQGLDLDWGRLACMKRQIDPNAEQEQERLDRAIEKAERARERRRAREATEADDN